MSDSETHHGNGGGGVMGFAIAQPILRIWSGRSQAVRLPKDFRFEAQEVRSCRHGNAGEQPA